MGVRLCARWGGVILKSAFQLKEAFKADPLGCDGMIRCPLPTPDGFSSCETKVSRTPPPPPASMGTSGRLCGNPGQWDASVSLKILSGLA